jgi:TRAP-type transport system periplasmic protein
MGFRSFLAAANIAAVLSFWAMPGQAQQTLRIAGNFPADHSSSKAMELFKGELSKLSGGALAADLFPGMQLGGAKENMDAVRAGTIFGTWIGVAYVSRLVPEVEAVSLPFVFDNRQQAMGAIDGPVGKVIDDKLAAKGFQTLGWMELGARHVTNSKRPLKTLEDFNGLKIRMQPNETHLATFRSIGANPIPLDIKELYSALQQGVVDGEENPYPIVQGNRFYEVQKYLSDTAHFFDFIILIANKKTFDALPPEQRKAVTDAARTTVVEQRKLAAEQEAVAFADLKAKGMTFNPLSAETRAALRNASAGIIDDVRKRAGGDLVDQMLAAAGKK